MRRVLADNQLPAAPAVWLADQGHHAEHVLPLGLAPSPDAEIWQRAARDGANIITKDEDYSRMTVLRPEPVAVIWLPLENCRKTALLEAMERAWPDLMRQLDEGARLIEVL